MRCDEEGNRGQGTEERRGVIRIMSILKFKDTIPHIAQDVFLADGSKIIGDVVIGEKSSIWFNTVVRGDVHYIRIGKKTNIQDLSMVHVAASKYPAIVGDEVTVGHRAIIHACQIGDRCLIGMGAIVMDGAEIGDDCIVAAGSLVTEGTKVPPGSVVKGLPGKVVREIRPEELNWIKQSAQNYFELAKQYR